jgi:DNA mismatch repair ATPase MutL
MFERIKSVLFVVCVVMIFTAQSNPHDNRKQQEAASRPAPAARNNQSRPQAQNQQQDQSRPQAQNRPQVQTRRAVPQQVVQRQPQRVQTRQYQPVDQQKAAPRVYAEPASRPVENNRLFHRQHHKNWQPRYNYYDNQYHFYPYVNIAAVVELAGGYIVVGTDGQNYYYDQGTFYLQDQGGRYVAVPPPVGIIVNPIAAGARQINFNGQILYRYKGVFYIQVEQGFQVIGPVQMASADT